MKPAAVVLMVSLAAALAACGKSEEATTQPAAEEPTAVAPPMESDAVPTPPPAEPAPEATAPVAPTEAPPASPAAPPPTTTPPAPSSAAPAPSTAAPARTAPSSPAETTTAQAPAATPAPAASGEAAATPSADLAHGEQVYRKSCAFCHDRGTAGAPKLGDAQAWAPRIAQGNDVLYTNSIKGIRAMPPKGGNPTLSEADVKAAVDFLVARAR